MWPADLGWLGGQGQGCYGGLPLPGSDSISQASGHSSSSSPVDPCWYSPHFPATAAACCTSHAHLLEVCSLPTLTAGPPGLPKLKQIARLLYFFFLYRIIFLCVYKPQSLYPFIVQRLPWWLRASEPASACNAGDLGSIPGWEDP